jgi:putative CocE/NonD family hydrolase
MHLPRSVVLVGCLFAISLASTSLVARQSSRPPEGATAESGDSSEARRQYGVAIVRDVMVPMRDGVKLATDLYFPAKDGLPLPGPWPAVIERTPYNKTVFLANAPDGPDYARSGYVMVVQDVRGRYASEGIFGSYTQEAPDGLDAFKWVANQSWSNRKIAVTGSSYFASTAQAILVQNPPGLTAAVIRVGPGNYHEDGAWQGGAFLLAHNVNYAMRLAAESQEVASKPELKAGFRAIQTPENAFNQMVRSPLGPKASFFALTPSYEKWYQDWQNHELYDDYWKVMGNGFSEHYKSAPDVPVLLITEWYDAFLGGMLEGFAGYGHGRKSPVRLIVGPGEHRSVYSMSTFAGGVDFGQGSAIDVHGDMLDWFDQHVKQIDRGVKSGHSARLFRIEGRNGAKNSGGRLQAGGTWQEFDSWPPADARPTKYYLGGDLSLTAAPPAAASINYTYNPSDPVPSIGGSVSSGGAMVVAGPFDQRCSKLLPQCKNELPLNARADVLAFTTPFLQRDMEVTGVVSAQLWVSSSAVDTDFTAMLIDQYPPTPDYPDGFAMPVRNSVVRARLRSNAPAAASTRRMYAQRSEPLTPGEVYEVTIDLSGVSYQFRAGHRLRLDISSSNFPIYDANPNTGEPFGRRRLPPIVARNTIYVGGDRPSQLVLPVR